MKIKLYTLFLFFAMPLLALATNNGDEPLKKAETTPAFEIFLTGNVIITEIMYNNPGVDDYEFVELYNRGATAVDMTGWTFSKGITFTFPAYTLQPDSFVIVAIKADLFTAAFGVPAFQFTGALVNTGEPVELSDASGTVVNAVTYGVADPWPTAPNGGGSSLVLCDFNSDNSLPANWKAATTPSGFVFSNVEFLVNPGKKSGCPTGPTIAFIGREMSVNENAGTLKIKVAINGGTATSTQVTVGVDAASTATAGSDHSLTAPVTLTFPAGAVKDTQEISINIVDDAMIEENETIILNLKTPTNGATIIANADKYTITILDNDKPLGKALVITGIYDTQPAGAGVKGIEMKALKDIPDLSIYGVGSANNGGGSSGVETSLPAISVKAGQCIYLADDSTKFKSFFGFSPTAIGGAVNINGDDAIELFENNQVIDVFGDISYTSGTILPWNYLDGWAYRKSGTGPDGSTFVLANWTFSGIDALDNVPNNASAPIPFPTCTYTATAPTTIKAVADEASTEFNTEVVIKVLVNDARPNPITSLTISVPAAKGTATVNGLADITYKPNKDFCGSDKFTYKICDANGCSEAEVTVTVACAPTYPAYSIAKVTTVTPNNGQPDSLNVKCQIEGIVHGIDIQGGAAIQFTLIDATGGITVFSSNSFGYTVTEGDRVIVKGAISQFNCLTQIAPDTLWKVSAGNALVTPKVVTVLDESTESELVRINNLTLVDPAQWRGNGSSFNVDVTNGMSTFTLRIDNDVDLASKPAPTGTFHAVGLGGQFDNDGICDSGYQLLPRYSKDIISTTNTAEEMIGRQIRLYPNPVTTQLFIQTELSIESISISNTLGQQLMDIGQPGTSVDIQSLPKGTYIASFRVNGLIWSTRVVKQ